MARLQIDIVSGITEMSNRANIKALFEQFGEVTACWLPPRGLREDPNGERAYVKFKNQASAEAAIEKCNNSYIAVEDVRLLVCWRGAGATRQDSRDFDAKGSNFISARDIFLQSRKGGKAKEKDRDKDRKKKSSKDKKRKRKSSSSASSRSSKAPKAIEDSSRAIEDRHEVAVAIEDQPAVLALMDGDAECSQTRSRSLLAAAKADALKECMSLLKARADANETPASGGLAPLHVAAQRGSAGICAALLLARADANAAASDGCSALHFAARSGALEVCAALLEVKALVNAQDTAAKTTPLHIAASLGHAAICEALTKANASASLQDASGRTPLDIMKEREEEERKRRQTEEDELEKRRRQRERRLKSMKTLEEREEENRREQEAQEEKKRSARERRQKAREEKEQEDGIADVTVGPVPIEAPESVVELD